MLWLSDKRLIRNLTNCKLAKIFNDELIWNFNLRKEAYFDYEICPEIHLLNERLTRFTYLVPFLSTKSISGAKYLPYFLSLSGLKEEAVKNKFMKAKIEARIFDYSLQAPPYASIYVRCRKCQYINFAPFHCVRALQPSFLNYMLKNYETDIGNTQFMTQQQENDDFEKKRLECSKDFSLRWLNTAEVLGWEGISCFKIFYRLLK